jgi:RNA methyltransferase, TrmH family
MPIKKIASHSNPWVKLTRALHLKPNRIRNNKFLLEGIRLLESAKILKFPLELVFYTPGLKDTARGEALLHDLKAEAFFEISEDLMHYLSATEHHQGILAVAGQVHYSLEGLLKSVSPVLILDCISDPGNLGSIFRTAWASGAGIILVGNTVETYNPKVVRASMGGVLKVTFVQETKAETLVSRLKQHGFEVYLAEAQADKYYWEEKYPQKSAFVLGSEAFGFRSNFSCLDKKIALPMSNGAESLNVSNCAGILLYEHLRQTKDHRL